jgi:two-component system sensor histidine kinase HydH
MTRKPNPERPHPLNLTRWFGLLALVTIGAITICSVWLISWFVSQRMLQQEGALTREFVQSLMLVETPLQDFFRDASQPVPPEIEDSFRHIAGMPDVLRANLYDRSKRVIWSSDRTLVGREFGSNDELDKALSGAVVVESKTEAQRLQGKAEYESLRQPDDLFVEIYVPVLDVGTGGVIGAIEFYKNPRGLTQMLAQLRSYITIGGAVFGSVLFLALFGLVRRADLTIRAQQRQLVNSETLAAIGEMSTAVAHGIRNPLASIRSSAELIPGSQPQRIQEAAEDIVAQSDRLEAWVRELLSYTRPLNEPSTRVAVGPLVEQCVRDYARELKSRGIQIDAATSPHLPPVRGNPLLLGQVLRSLLANAIEAMSPGGRIAVHSTLAHTNGQITLSVRDSGPGMTPEQLARVGKPFYTTKPRGLGVGLSLARRIIERSGGRMDIESTPGQGTVVTLHLAIA